MNALQQFLLEQDITNLTKEIVPSGRLKDHPLTIRAINGQQYTSFQQLCIENPNSPKKRRFNTKKFNELIAINGLVNPNMKEAEFLEKANCADPAQLLYRLFLAGEINTIASEVLALSGFDQDMEEEIEEAKNS